MSGTYRVCLYVEGHETRLGLALVSKEEDGTTRCQAVASTEVFATLDDLKRGLEQMRAACELPMLTISHDEQVGEGFEESI